MPKGDNLRGKGGLKFGEGQKINLEGRKKSKLHEVWSILIGEHEEDQRLLILNKDERYKLLQQLFDLNKTQLLGVISNDKTPVFVSNIAIAIIEDMENGRTFTIDKYFDRFYGKAESKTSITGGQDENGNDKPLQIIEIRNYESDQKADKGD